MLVLSRKVNEVIWVGRGVRIQVVTTERGKVRLGIDAPSDTSIIRQELLSEEDLAERLRDLAASK